VGQSAGELTFSRGDVIIQLAEADAAGMCKGMKADGTVGLFPAAKVAAFSQ